MKPMWAALFGVPHHPNGQIPNSRRGLYLTGIFPGRSTGRTLSSSAARLQCHSRWGTKGMPLARGGVEINLLHPWARCVALGGGGVEFITWTKLGVLADSGSKK